MIIEMSSGPDGEKFKVLPGNTYRGRTLKCLSDVEVSQLVLTVIDNDNDQPQDLPPQQCGIVLTCLEKKDSGEWR